MRVYFRHESGTKPELAGTFVDGQGVVAVMEECQRTRCGEHLTLLM